MRHLALSGVFAVILGSASAQKYGGGGGTGVSPTSGGSSGPSGPGGSGGSGISSLTDGICPLPEPTTVFVTVTQPAVILPPPTTVTFTVPNSPFGYTSGVSAAPGPEWPSGAPDQTLTVPCTTGPDGRPVPSGPGLVTLTYPAPPGESPGVGTYSLITIPPSQTGYPGGPFGVSSSPGGPGGQGLSSNPGWGSFGSSPEPTVTITVPVGTPAEPWGSVASTSPEGYGGTYPFPEPTLTLSYHPSPGGNGGGGQGGSSYLPTLTLTPPEGPPGGQGGSATDTFTNPYALPTVTVTEPGGESGGSGVPGGPGGQGGTYPFPEPTLTLSYNPPGGGSPGSDGGQGWTTVPEGSIGPSNPWPEVTVTIPPNGQPSDTPGGPGGQGWSSTPCDTFGPSNSFPEVTVTVPPPNGQPSDTPGGGFGPSNSLPEITVTLPDTTLTVPYSVPNEPTPSGQGSVPLEGLEVKDGAAHLAAALVQPTLYRKSPSLFPILRSLFLTRYPTRLLPMAKALFPLEGLEVKDGAAHLAAASVQPTLCRKSPSLFPIRHLLSLTRYPMSLAVVKPPASLKAATVECLPTQQLLSLPLEPHPVVEVQEIQAVMGALEVQLARLSPADMDGQARVLDQEVRVKEAHHHFSRSRYPTLEHLVSLGALRDQQGKAIQHPRLCLPCLGLSLSPFPAYLGPQ
ncbi:hypothetical protein PG999_004605 [Apiospora kogelbergensis]|uniref:Uncharacterized protein n=1 Tax=Apiospora kogelbergensis TaxID=1337665 RepID=A0AAW0QZS6_9PEZI